MNPKLKYWLALSNTPGVGPIKARRHLEIEKDIELLCRRLNCDINWAEEEIKRAEKAGVVILCQEDAEYPKNLLNIHDPPLALYVRGKFTKGDDQALAIVGTRKATAYGLKIAQTLALELSSLGITIVSGLALGIDTAGHWGAIEGSGRTIAVFGTGIDIVYPPSNQKLAERILENGALISEFPIGTTPDKWTFPQRNRIISGLSLGVIVVEGAEDSGALITAKLAVEQGREVFAVPGSIQNQQASGPHALIKQGAKLVQGIDDILEELQPIIGKKTAYPKPKPEKIDFSAFSNEEQKILNALTVEAKHIDRIARETGYSSSKTASLLALLEIRNAIKQLPGKLFALS